MENNTICKSKSLISIKKMKPDMGSKITFVNLIMTLGVIIYYFYGYYNELPMYDTWDFKIFDWFNFGANIIGEIAFGWFFLISGFFLYNNCESTKDMWTKVKKRFKTLGITYFIWNLIVLIYYIIKTPELPFNGVKGFIINLTLTPLNEPLWYMFALVLLLIPALLIVKLKNHKRISAIFFITICVLSFYISTCNIFPTITDGKFGFWVERFFRYLPVYFIGAYGGMYFSDFVLQEKYHNIVIIPLSIVLFFAYIVLCRKSENREIIWILGRVQPIAVWFLVYSKMFVKKLGMFFKCSFFAFALHGPILVDIITERINSFMNSGKVFYPIEIVLIKIGMLVLIYLISAGLAYFLKQIMKEKYFGMLSVRKL